MYVPNQKTGLSQFRFQWILSMKYSRMATQNSVRNKKEQCETHYHAWHITLLRLHYCSHKSIYGCPVWMQVDGLRIADLWLIRSHIRIHLFYSCEDIVGAHESREPSLKHLRNSLDWAVSSAPLHWSNHHMHAQGNSGAYLD
jgi:hypothetical protein